MTFLAPLTTTAAEAHRFSTSWLLPSYALGALRLLIALYIFLTLSIVLGIVSIQWHNPSLAGTQFTYFTVLTYWGLGFYFLVSGVHSIVYAATGRNLLERGGEGKLMGVLRWLHASLYASVTVFPFIVTVVFWTVLARNALSYPQLAWQNTSEHALNSVFAFLEILLPATRPHAWIHLFPLIVLLVFYLALTYISHAIRGYYVYPFLDPVNGAGGIVGILVGTPVATAVVFAVVKGAIWGRMRVSEKGQRGKGKGNLPSVDVEEIDLEFPKAGENSNAV
ncbi:hypothetical protein MBLNU457_7719t1 [Dothideomycetes sp. NU457]